MRTVEHIQSVTHVVRLSVLIPIKDSQDTGGCIISVWGEGRGVIIKSENDGTDRLSRRYYPVGKRATEGRDCILHEEHKIAG